jgi:hypothetical protein
LASDALNTVQRSAMPTESDPTSDSVVFATAPEGLTLPVIDVTHPDFAVPDDPASLAAQRDAFIEWDRRNRRLPQFLSRLLMQMAARRSRLVRALVQSDSGYLDSITTYVMKLGDKHLPPGFDGPVDRKIASAPHVPLLRLRMQQIAKLLAGALVEPLERDANAPLRFINIAGGPALDSINAIIRLNRSHAALLKRPIAIDVLDQQAAGPAFGQNALVALQAAGGPLRGLDVEFRHRPYDWNDTAALRSFLAERAQQGAIMAASSEGGLFEYGGDDAIVANLTVLREASVEIVAGSVTGSDAMRKRMIAQTNFRLFPRGLEGFAPLAARAGYAIARAEPAILSDQVLLRPVVPPASPN